MTTEVVFFNSQRACIEREDGHPSLVEFDEAPNGTTFALLLSYAKKRKWAVGPALDDSGCVFQLYVDNVTPPRDERVTVRLARVEVEALDALAKRAERSRSDYLRLVILSHLKEKS